MLRRLWAKIKKWFDELKEVLETKPEPPPTDEELENDPPEAPPATFFSELVWLRTDTWGPRAQITKKLSNLRIYRDKITFTLDNIGDWPETGPHPTLHGVMCAAIYRDGKWRGGKFDHLRATTTVRDFNNIGGYLVIQPKSGEAIRFWALSYDGTQASNVVEVNWV